MSERLALGTAQFGLRYGVANRSGQVSRDDARAILAYAAAAGITTLDTAIAYGDSEERLGQIGVAGWNVVSKLPALPDSCPSIGAHVWEQTQDALRRLRIQRLYGLLLHRPQNLLERSGAALYSALLTLKERGAVDKIGVSIYDPEELDMLTQRFRLDIVQAPFNIVDRRLASSGWLTRLHDAGTEVHIRSVFLQGLLLMRPEARPVYFNRWQPLLDEWQAWLQGERMSPLRACLGFVLSNPAIGRAIVGVESAAQLGAIVDEAAGPPVAPPIALSSEDPWLINPSCWTLP